MKLILRLLILVFLFDSCELLYFEKRHYNRGFFIQLTGKEQKTLPQTRPESCKHALLPIDKVANLRPRSPVVFPGQGRILNEEVVFRPGSILRRTERKKVFSRQRSVTAAFPSPKYIPIPLTLKSHSHPKIKAVPVRPEKRRNAWELLLIPLLTVPVLYVSGKNRMAKWAGDNRRQAQWLVALMHFVIPASGYALGQLLPLTLEKNGVGLMEASAGLFAGSLLLSLAKPRLRLRAGYLAGKWPNVLLAFSSALVGVEMGSRDLRRLSSSLADWSFSQGISNQLPPNDNPMIIHPVLAVFLTILVIIVLVFSLYVLAVIACNLACSGYAALAVVVFFGGGLLRIYGTVYTLFLLYKRKVSRWGSEKDRKKKMASWSGIITAAFLILFLLLLILQ